MRRWLPLVWVGSLAIVPALSGQATTAVANDPAQVSGSFTWLSWKPVDTEAAELIDRFNEQYPDVEVEYQFQQYTDYVNNLRLSMAAGEGPDLWFGQSGAFIREYSEFAEDLRPYAENEWGSDWDTRFIIAGLNEGIIDGKVAGIPWMLLGAGYIWYNATIFEDVGVEPPTTMEELATVAAELDAAGVTPFIQGAADNWVNFDVFMAIANQTAPGHVYRAEAGEVAWDSPGLVEAMEIWQRLFDEGIMQDGALGIQQYPDAADVFAIGDAAMIMQGTWNNRFMTNETLAELQDTYGYEDEFVFLPFLFPDVNGDGEPASLAVGPDAIPMMNADAENKDAVWAFIAFLLGDDVQRDSHAANLIPPSVADIELDRSDIATEQQGLVLDEQAELMAAAEYPREFNSPETQAALGDALQQVASGSESPAEALADVEAALQE